MRVKSGISRPTHQPLHPHLQTAPWPAGQDCSAGSPPATRNRHFAPSPLPGREKERFKRRLWSIALLLSLVLPAHAYTVVNDGIPAPLTAEPGDATRGRAIVASRQTGLCLLCHSGPFPEERSQGNLSSDLSGAGSRWTEAQLRLRVADARRLNPRSLMPSFHPAQLPDDQLAKVGRAWQGRPVLSAQQVEDVVAYLKAQR